MILLSREMEPISFLKKQMFLLLTTLDAHSQ